MNPSVIDTILAWRWGTSTLTFYRKRSQHPVVVVVAAVGDFYNKLHRYILLWRSMVASEAPPPPPQKKKKLEHHFDRATFRENNMEILGPIHRVQIKKPPEVRSQT